MNIRRACTVVTHLGVAVLAVASVGATECPRPTASTNVLTAGNCLYDVALRPLTGGYTAGTGIEHPVTKDLGGRQTTPVGGGQLLGPFERSVSIRSWRSGTDYLFDTTGHVLLTDNGFTCVPAWDMDSPDLTEIVRDDGQVVGLIARFDVEEADDELGVEIRILAHGEHFENSAVEVTATVENRAPDEARLGIRYFWDIGMLGVGGAALGPVPPEPPQEPWVTQEGDWTDPGFDCLFAAVTDTPSTEAAYYFGGISVAGPWPLDPVPTAPDRIVRSAAVKGSRPEEKVGPGNVCFLWEVPDPPRGGPHGGGPQAVVYYWGETEDSAISLGPGESTSVTVWFWAFLENPVTCDAGGPYPQTECTGPRTPVPVDGSLSRTAEGNALLYRWSSPEPGVDYDDPAAGNTIAYLPTPGTYPLSLDVGIGPYTRVCGAEAEVVDTTPPDLRVPAPLVLRTSEFGAEDCELPATLLAEADDLCWLKVDVAHTTDPYLGEGGDRASYLFPPGTTRVVFTAEDPSGNIATSETSVTVIDDTPPQFILLEAEPELLWPPNHRMEEISVRAEVRDNCDATPQITLFEVESSEPDDDRGDGHTFKDIQGTDPGSADFTFLLRSERDGSGAGRVYTLRYLAADRWDNQTVGETLVIVPHDMGPDQ